MEQMNGQKKKRKEKKKITEKKLALLQLILFTLIPKTFSCCLFVRIY